MIGRTPPLRPALGVAACLAACLAVGCRTAAPPTPPPQSTGPAGDTPPPEMADAIADVDAAIDAERKRLGIGAAALLVVKDGEVIHARGFGTRIGGESPVDADTVFAIGSLTQAFTALLVMKAVEAETLALSDSPRKCLPEFALKDPEANDKVTVRDLLTHRAGLAAMDLPLQFDAFSRADTLTVLAAADPLTPYGQQFRYQNLMVVAAGECAARTFGGSYADALGQQILQPLGMEGASLGRSALLAEANHADGHTRRGEGGAVAVPPRNLDGVAPAVGMNASARALAPWLRMMMGGGRVDDTQLISTPAFQRIVAPHVVVTPGLAYGLGWFIDQYAGRQRVWHRGDTDGYYGLIGMLPDEGLGFVFLTGDEAGAQMQGLVFDEVFGLAVTRPPANKAVEVAADAVGTYGIIGGFQAVLAADEDGGTLTVPDKPPYPLGASTDGGDGSVTYVLDPPAPAELSVTVSAPEVQPRTLTIVQPAGPVTLPRLDPQTLADAQQRTLPTAERALLGAYRDAERGIVVQLIQSEGRLALSAAGQAPAPLVADGKSVFRLDGLPNAFAVELVRKRGRVSGLRLLQPQGTLTLQRVPGTEPVTDTAEDLLQQSATAHGRSAMAKHRTMEVHSRVAFVHQGLQGYAQTRRIAPDRMAIELRYGAGDKTLGTQWLGYDGREAWSADDGAPAIALRGHPAESLGLEAAFNPWAAPMDGFATAEVAGVGVLPGLDEAVVFVERVSSTGLVWIDAVGRTSHLLRQRTTKTPTAAGSALVEVWRYDDYREVGGVQVPHVVQSSTANGAVVSTVESVRFDTPLADADLRPPR